jgi:hypothetical protein
MRYKRKNRANTAKAIAIMSAFFSIKETVVLGLTLVLFLTTVFLGAVCLFMINLQKIF